MNSRRNERGFLMAVVLFAIVALSIAGATSVLMSSSDLNIIGSERVRHQVEACADAGVDAAIATLPDTTWTSSVPPYPTDPKAAPGAYAAGLYYAGDGLVARVDHYNTAVGGKIFTVPLSENKLPPEAAAAFLNAGGNLTNLNNPGGAASGAGAAGIMGSGMYRMVSTCVAPNSQVKQEVESVVVYGVGH